MQKKTKITPEEQMVIRTSFDFYPDEFLLNAIKENLRQQNKPEIDQECESKLSRNLMLKLAFDMLLLTSVYDMDKDTYWIDRKGYYQVKIERFIQSNTNN